MQPQDLALTMLGTYLRRPMQLAWSGGMVELLGAFDFSVEASRAALNRLATRELVARQKTGREVFYALTPRAEELLAEGDARIFRFGRNTLDGRRWTVLWHSLPQSRRVERARLANRLRFLGFGSVQDATWVVPHDREKEVVDLLERLGVRNYAYVLTGRPAAALDIDVVIRQAWNLDEVDRQYREFIAEFSGLRSKRAQRALSDREAFVARTKAIHAFRGFPSLDPELPEELMAKPGRRTNAIALFDEVFDGLQDAAHGHFDAVTRADVPATPP